MAIETQILRQVIDGAFGELEVTFRNTTGAAVNNVHVTVSDNGPLTDGAQGSIAYIPGTADGGYAIDAPVANNAEVTRTFCMKPVDAEAGKRYQAAIQVTWTGSQEDALTEIFVEARPEVYVTLGAAERLRQTMLNAYEDFKETGKQVHEETALPESGGEPAHEALQPAALQWALSALELGVRLLKTQRGKDKVDLSS